MSHAAGLEASAQRREQLRARLAKEGVDLSKGAIPRLPRDSTGLPLSFAQQRLWFFDQLEPGSAIYNIPIPLRLTGPLDLTALQKSLEEIVRRHEVFRTKFAVVDAQPVQTIVPATEVPLPMLDLTAHPDGARESKMLLLASLEAERPFDLGQSPLLRAKVLRLGEHEHVLLLTTHHIAYDGWSLGVFLKELGILYGAFTANRAPALSELPVQYADFAAWQRARMDGPALEKQLAYWRKQLAGFSAFELPTDHPRPAVQRFKGATREWLIPAPLERSLRALSRSRRVTLFMTALAAFKVLLYRHSGQADVLVACPVAGRQRAETHGLIGCFLNTLIHRTDLAGNPTFLELLKRVQQVALGAYANQDLPFDRLVAEIQPDRVRAYAPIFNIMFTLDNAPASPAALPGLSVTPLAARRATAGADLDLTILERDYGLKALLEYDTDLFKDATIVRILEHFEVLLEAIAADPAVRIDELPLLTAAERRQVLLEWSAGPSREEQQFPLHELFEKQAEQRADAIAIALDDEQLTYGELNRRANQLARYLLRGGAGPETRVGVCLNRGLELVNGVLGIWKAGAVYVPLDPSYPPERLAHMLEDARAPILITSSGLGLRPRSSRVLLLDKDSDFIAGERDTNLGLAVHPENAAYVIYTSGSTGWSKGVVIEQRGMLNHLQVKVRDLHLTQSDVVAQTASCSFDISIWQFLAALLAGGKVQILNDEAARDAALTLEVSERTGVSVLETVPGLLGPMLDAQLRRGSGRLPLLALRWVISTAEALPLSVCRGWLECHPHIRLLNAYGPTECSDDVTHYAIPLTFDPSPGMAPLGRPVQGLRIYVLDPRFEPVPAGVQGELFIGGAGVGRGYLNRPDLTAEKFLPDPFGPEPGARLYRTGDRARWLPGGNLEYFGRIDQQVKIRGYRVELGEVEAVLSQHPGVLHSAVVADEDAGGSKRLIAYVVPRHEREVAVDELRKHAQARLPHFMIPAAMVILPELPLTENGKLNRKALPRPEWGQPAEERIAPRTSLEEIVAGVWMEVLRVERLGVHDNFFDLGGHSLLATQVISRLHGLLRVALPLRSLFEAPTVAGLAAQVERSRRDSSLPEAPPIVPAQREGELPLSYAQQRLWFTDQLGLGSSAYNLHTAIRIGGPLDVNALERSLNEILRRHAVLRTRLVNRNGEPVQIIAPERAQSLPVWDLTTLPQKEREAELSKLARQEAGTLFDLSVGPLLRATLVHLADQEYALLATMHHVASDGWSLGILVREFSILYESFLQGLSSPLPELELQYTDYAVWQREWLTGDVLEQQLSYWKRQLRGNLPVLQLPTDWPRPPAQQFAGAAESFVLSEELAAKLRNLSRKEGATLFITLMAAFQTLLYRYSGQQDILVGTDVANRNRLETEELIGFFVNQLVLRTDLGGNPSFRELLGRTREVMLEASAHQDLPFERLVEELSPARNTSYAPLFQVKLVLQNMAAFRMPGLRLTPLPVETQVVKLDLQMTMLESGEGLRGAIEFNTGLFAPGTIRRMVDHWKVLLEGIVARPECPVDELPLMTEAERRETLLSWNNTRVDDVPELCVHEIFERLAEQRPDAVATVCQGMHLTYGELNRRANQTGRHLQTLGVGPGVTVAICMSRSLDLITGTLGVWKAGAAYVPVDPGYPTERISFLLEDAQAPVILTQERLRAALPALWAEVVCMDSAWERIAMQSEQNPAVPVTTGHVAYVIYTSGSTGRPKGVMVPHRGLANYLNMARRTYRLESGRTPFHTSLSFDLTVTSLWGPLVSGGCIEILPEDGGVEPLRDALEDATAQSAVKLTPAHLQALADGGSPPAGARLLVIGGEALYYEALQSWRNETAGTRLVNEYGPTETVVGCCVYELESADPGHGAVPIGRPIDNTELYVLNRALEPEPVGVTGELFVSGAGLAYGYRGKPALTAERFVPDPFGNRVGGRLYRTGDRVRRRPDGQLEYIGRNDEQVKIRGHRVEMGEIEAVLLQHPDVRAAAVRCWEHSPSEKSLAAYIIARDGIRPAVSDLRAFLRRMLPEYMTPAAIVQLADFPLTPNGKVDRQSLPSPEPAVDATAAFVPPRTDAEELMAGIWRDSLSLDQVGIRDDFFQLGGHSLMAAKLVSRVRDVFGVEVPLTALFADPTIAGLLGFIAGSMGGGDALAEVSRTLREIELMSDSEVQTMISQIGS